MSEIARLRWVYEAARKALRYYGAAMPCAFEEAVRQLEDACEEVKLFDAGNDIDIEKEARELIQLADELGITLRIDLKPKQPLAMGNHEYVIETWAKREK